MVEKNEAINYFDTVLTEVIDRHGALAAADPLERWERLFSVERYAAKP